MRFFFLLTAAPAVVGAIHMLDYYCVILILYERRLEMRVTLVQSCCLRLGEWVREWMTWRCRC
jgi:hypothetical protein